MRAAGVTDYLEFANKILPELKVLRPETNISLEVFADDYDNMLRQAKIIDELGNKYDYKVYVKIPVVNTEGKDNYKLITDLNAIGVKVNVTAVFTKTQTAATLDSLTKHKTESIISIFAGRIADTSYDAEELIKNAIMLRFMPDEAHVKFLWASCREVFNVVQAERAGCDIITMTSDQIKKYFQLKNKNLTEYSRETVQMFYNDALASGYTL